jgi:hypothetical protein
MTLIFLTSCKEKKNISTDNEFDGKVWDIKLENNLGNIKIILPKHLDTIYKWTQYSDCGDGCANYDYRVQPKNLPFFKDDGFYWHPLKDSVESFTIKHPKVTRQFTKDDTMLIRQLSGILKHNYLYERNVSNFSIDTVFIIGDNTVAAIAFSDYDTSNKANVQMLNAMTVINGNLVEINFECRKSYNDPLSKKFIHNAFEALKKMQINNSRQQGFGVMSAD